MKKREKKISIKYYLNNRSKGHVDSNGNVLFPLYIRINFNKKSTSLPISSLIGDNEYNKFHNVTLAHYESNLKGKEVLKNDWKIGIDRDKLENIIKFEYNMLKSIGSEENYTLKNFANRYLIYNKSITNILERDVSSTVLKKMGDVLTHNQYLAMEEEYLTKYASAFNVVKDTSTFLTSNGEEHLIELAELSEYEFMYSVLFSEKMGINWQDILDENTKKKFQVWLEIFKYDIHSFDISSKQTEKVLDKDGAVRRFVDFSNIPKTGFYDWFVTKEARKDYLKFLETSRKTYELKTTQRENLWIFKEVAEFVELPASEAPGKILELTSEVLNSTSGWEYIKSNIKE